MVHSQVPIRPASSASLSCSPRPPPRAVARSLCSSSARSRSPRRRVGPRRGRSDRAGDGRRRRPGSARRCRRSASRARRGSSAGCGWPGRRCCRGGAPWHRILARLPCVLVPDANTALSGRPGLGLRPARQRLGHGIQARHAPAVGGNDAVADAPASPQPLLGRSPWGGHRPPRRFVQAADGEADAPEDHQAYQPPGWRRQVPEPAPARDRRPKPKTGSVLRDPGRILEPGAHHDGREERDIGKLKPLERLEYQAQGEPEPR